MTPVRSTAIPFELEPGQNEIEVTLGGKRLRLTNLQKQFWPELGVAKRDLLLYYSGISEYLLPHLRDRAMVMKRYPNGIAGSFFFMKRAPIHRPQWIRTCSIEHASGNIIDFPMVQDLASLLWVVNLGCIDLNQWYARCDDVQRPDYVHFDLDPTEGAGIINVLEAAILVHEELNRLKLPNFAKTTGSRGIHIYVPIKRGPEQKRVWGFAKELAKRMASKHPEQITAEYRVAKRPPNRVLVDYNQNAWGRTLASVYSVRPKPMATVSTPVTWEEVERGFRMEDFRIENVPERVRSIGDLWEPITSAKGRVDLERLL